MFLQNKGILQICILLRTLFKFLTQTSELQSKTYSIILSCSNQYWIYKPNFFFFFFFFLFKTSLQIQSSLINRIIFCVVESANLYYGKQSCHLHVSITLHFPITVPCQLKKKNYETKDDSNQPRRLYDSSGSIFFKQ